MAYINKEKFLKELTRYHAFGDCDTLDVIISMIGVQFKDHLLRNDVFDLSQKIENNYHDYYEAEDRNAYFNKLWNKLNKEGK